MIDASATICSGAAVFTLARYAGSEVGTSSVGNASAAPVPMSTANVEARIIRMAAPSAASHTRSPRGFVLAHNHNTEVLCRRGKRDCLPRNRVPTGLYVRGRLMRWDGEDTLDLADIGGETGTAAHGASVTSPGQMPKQVDMADGPWDRSENERGTPICPAPLAR